MTVDLAAQGPTPGLLVAACLAVAAFVAVASMWLSIVLVQEYGPVEGYGALVLQVLPIGGLGIAVAVALVWFATRLRRR